MRFLRDIQTSLERWYGAATGLDVGDFVVPTPDFPGLGELLVHQENHDLEMALIFDRDILAAWNPGASEDSRSSEATLRTVTVPFEEVSHFVYLSFNHNRGRNVTALEMEIQSEIDRVLLAYHGEFGLSEAQKSLVLEELLERPYRVEAPERYEESRRTAARLVRQLAGGDPRAWSRRELDTLRSFFHSDLSEKIRLSRPK